ncbi:RNA 2',3'-cyclic phosphodiesterase [Chitiniphilus purpureus]|uniref:RNA 2',3'-cyclic phosphodiesterase n=1 Tax=Chitiniphilus purpureus TaxID=2981137 RepID=A0ABY6DJT0_9NEIS|nr:RNA 2',3'-cyclic phosphodiesterase [Chitiniphilus sp. CD1]UXY13691.1 RNA 2',3'-cyclic phosphodiesterase [Chitiniphilus sp. CD1]
MAGPDMQRLFIALAPPPMLLPSLVTLRDQLHAEVGGRAMPAANLHLTLAFLGETPAAQVPVLLARLATLSRHRAHWRIDRVGSFKTGSPKGCIVWAGGPASAGLTELVGTLWQALREDGMAFDAKPFVPHVTLLRAAGSVARTMPPLIWPLAVPQLYASIATAQGPRYARLGDP